MLAKEIKPGTVVVHLGSPALIESMTVQSPTARGGATFYKFRARNLVTKSKIDITLKGTESLDQADFERRPITFMYSDPDSYHFMDAVSYEQYAVPRDDISEEIGYITEGLEGILGLVYNGEVVGVALPTTIELVITQTDPGVKGNSATGRTKPATLQTGLIIHVPEYLSEGELIKVDSRTGAFLGRA